MSKGKGSSSGGSSMVPPGQAPIGAFFKKVSEAESNSILSAAKKDSSGRPYHAGAGVPLSSLLPGKGGAGSSRGSTTGVRARSSIGSGGGAGLSNKKARVDTRPAAPDDDELEDVTLSEAQRKVLATIMERKSVFFTGAAGTGKSFVLRVLQQVFAHVKRTAFLSITATTGIAACNIRGMTIHSWSGLGLGTESLETTVARASKNQYVKKRWCDCETLVIDEISMLSAELFDKISAIGRRCRNDPRPFGGMQVIVSGDFFQLPPVGLGNSCHFCFESPVWAEMFGGARKDGMIVLDKVFRQKDSLFLRMLNELRRGHVSPATERLLNDKVADSRRAKLENEKNGVASTKLFPVNRRVDDYNAEELRKLRSGVDEKGQPLSYVYHARDEGDRQLLGGIKSMPEVELRVGAQVMLLKNISTDSGLVNGTRGKVVRFEYNENFNSRSKTPEGMPENLKYFPVIDFTTFVGSEQSNIEFLIDFDNPAISWTNDVKNGEKVLAERTQIPLMLSWAMSIHKSQGMTIPLLEVSTAGSFEYGQAYVALSRAVDLPGLTLMEFNRSSVKAHDRVRAFYSSMGVKDVAEEIDDCTVKSSITELARSFVSYLPDPPDDPNDGWMETARPKAAPQGWQSNNTMAMDDIDALLDEAPAVRRAPPVQQKSSSSSSDSVYGHTSSTTSNSRASNSNSSGNIYGHVSGTSSSNSSSSSSSASTSTSSSSSSANPFKAYSLPSPPHKIVASASGIIDLISPVAAATAPPELSDDTKRRIMENRERALRRLEESRRRA